MESKQLYENISVKKEDSGEVEITGEIPQNVIEKYRPSALKELGKDLDLPGFRKGNIPEKVLIERLGEQAVLYEIAEAVLKDAYPEIIQEHKLNVVGRPEVNITKIAQGNPIGFSIKTAVLPEITLPDYKAIAKEVLAKEAEGADKGSNPIEVTEEDVNAVIEQITRNIPQSDEEKEAKKPQELTDEIVKTLGDFKTVTDFKEKLKKDLAEEKKRKLRESKRVSIGEKIIEKSSITLPRILIERDLEKMMAQMRGDVERMGMKFDEYLKQIKKDEKDIRQEWEKDAEKRAKLQLILNRIATTEKIYPKEEDMKREEGHILEHVKEADPNQVRVYVETLLTNEEVFKFLEGQAVGPERSGAKGRK